MQTDEKTRDTQKQRLIKINKTNTLQTKLRDLALKTKYVYLTGEFGLYFSETAVWPGSGRFHSTHHNSGDGECTRAERRYGPLQL